MIAFSLLVFIVSFLLGSIPFGLIISRVFYKEDIRRSGSGNIGTTNTMRVLGKRAGVATFLLDFGKGLLSGALAAYAAPALFESFVAASASLTVSQLASANALFLSVGLLGCVMGHIFSPWLKFKGGKGIAVAAGCLFFVFGPLGGLAEIVLFAVLVIATRYVSVGSIAAALLCPLLGFYYYWGQWFCIALICIAAALVLWAHRANIKRLVAGNENRIGSSKKQAEQEQKQADSAEEHQTDAQAQEQTDTAKSVPTNSVRNQAQANGQAEG